MRKEDQLNYISPFLPQEGVTMFEVKPSHLQAELARKIGKPWYFYSDGKDIYFTIEEGEKVYRWDCASKLWYLV